VRSKSDSAADAKANPHVQQQRNITITIGIMVAPDANQPSLLITLQATAIKFSFQKKSIPKYHL
jgi:hypothetical protein